MNTEDKKARLRYLNKQKALSDDEYDERERLIEELNLIEDLPHRLVKISKHESKKKRSILEIIIDHFKEKDVTPQELEQLKLKALKWRLKGDIADSKAKISKQKSEQFEKLLGGLGDKRTPEDFRNLFGNHNKTYTK